MNTSNHVAENDYQPLLRGVSPTRLVLSAVASLLATAVFGAITGILFDIYIPLAVASHMLLGGLVWWLSWNVAAFILQEDSLRVDRLHSKQSLILFLWMTTVFLAVGYYRNSHSIGDTSATQTLFERDEKVLDSVFKHFLDDPESRFAIAGSRPVLYVHKRNPTKLGILDQTDSDVGERAIPAGLIQKLIVRNRSSGYDTKFFALDKFNFNNRVRVVDVHEMLRSSGSPLPNFKAFDNSKGFMECYAPVYSDDGRAALVRAWVGPSDHGATVTYLLTKRDGHWIVEWREFARYV